VIEMKKSPLAKIVGIIHARGGSTRIPLKNIMPLAGKPLVAYMVEAAVGSRLLDRVIVSTDHPEIKRVSLEYGAEVPFDRPKEISSDCPSELVTQHAIKFVEDQQGAKTEIAVTMQPTTPFCRSDDIDECIRLLQENPRWESVFSAGLVRERPEWMFIFDEQSNARLMRGNVISGETGVMQSLPKLATPNGGVYATRRDVLFGKNLIISSETGIHLMSLERSVDIDEPIDLDFAQFLIEKGKV